MAEIVTLKKLVEGAVEAALIRVAPAGVDPLVRRSQHADFQSDVALSLAKAARRSPRDLAQALAEALNSEALHGRAVHGEALDGEAPNGEAPNGETPNGEAVSATVSGPGFLNLDLPDATIWEGVAARLGDDRLGDDRLGDDRLGIGRPLLGERVVVDYSAPNIAKEMHVGHLRTTIIGDALARVLGFLGADVIRQNHLGDWGTQFGMLIQYVDEHPDLHWRHDRDVSALDGLYRQSRAQFDTDAGFADRARNRVVALQAGDPATLAVWRELVEESEAAFQALYDRLGVLLTTTDSAGESTYNPFLGEIVDELVAKGIAVESDGALCVFFDGVTGPDGDPVPLIVRKADGGFGYAATDLATVRHRVRELRANRILYVVDARQALHFRMVFDAARRAGWLSDEVKAIHVAFGAVLGPDGRPFRTRSGGTVRLGDLLDAAVDRARDVIVEKPHGLDPDELERVAQSAGIGAVKYAELSTSRTKDYVFDVNRMVSLSGNTGVYLQYAHARIRSILRRLPDASGRVDPRLALHPAERALALTLDEFTETLTDVAHTLEPHRLCAYLYALAKAYTDFYENCPVLRADNAARQGNRVALCRLTSHTLGRGLELLGIEAPARM